MRTDTISILAESMTRIFFPDRDCTVRVWRQEYTESPYTDSQTEIADAVKKLYRETADLNHLARKVALIDRVNAVEVIDMQGNGMFSAE